VLLSERYNHTDQKSSPRLVPLLAGAYISRKGLESSDPRDRIFALLGMSADAMDLGAVPDYSKSKARVFTEVAMALINQVGLGVLAWSNRRFAWK